MAKLYCQAEIEQRLASLRNPSEETKLESPYGVRITHGIIQRNQYEYRCDQCNNIIEPGQQAILVEFFTGWQPPEEKYEGHFFQPRTIKEEVILYGKPEPHSSGLLL